MEKKKPKINLSEILDEIKKKLPPGGIVLAALLAVLIYYNYLSTERVIDTPNGNKGQKKTQGPGPSDIRGNQRNPDSIVVIQGNSLVNDNSIEITEQAATVNKINWLEISFISFVAILSIGVLYNFFSNPPVIGERALKPLDSEIDPDDVRDFFTKYSQIISLLGTPRKIKRFCNKIRYQYGYFFEEEDKKDKDGENNNRKNEKKKKKLTPREGLFFQLHLLFEFNPLDSETELEELISEALKKCNEIIEEYDFNKDDDFELLKTELENLNGNNFEQVKNDIIFKIIAMNQKIIV